MPKLWSSSPFSLARVTALRDRLPPSTSARPCRSTANPLRAPGTLRYPPALGEAAVDGAVRLEAEDSAGQDAAFATGVGFTDCNDPPARVGGDRLDVGKGLMRVRNGDDPVGTEAAVEAPFRASLSEGGTEAGASAGEDQASGLVPQEKHADAAYRCEIEGEGFKTESAFLAKAAIEGGLA